MVVAAVLAACTPPPPSRYQPDDPSDPYGELVLTRPGEGPIGAADPDVMRVGDTWYLYATTTDAGFEAWSSTDLRTWVYEGLVWTPTAGSWNDHGSYWAPDLHQSDAGFFLYYTAGEHIGVARADSPLGPFEEVLDHPLIGGGNGGVGDGTYWGTPTEPVPILDSDETAIDAFLFEAADGSMTLYFSSYPVLGIAVMSAIPMLDETTPAPGPATVVLEAEVASWELFIREAPVVYEHDGLIHLSYSGMGADTTCYSLGEATADNPLGPFVRKPTNPILHADPVIGFYGPGHHSIVEGPDGGLIMFFHTKNDYQPGYERRVRWAPVSIDANGELSFDVPPPGTAGSPNALCRFW